MALRLLERLHCPMISLLTQIPERVRNRGEHDPVLLRDSSTPRNIFSRSESAAAQRTTVQRSAAQLTVRANRRLRSPCLGIFQHRYGGGSLRTAWLVLAVADCMGDIMYYLLLDCTCSIPGVNDTPLNAEPDRASASVCVHATILLCQHLGGRE